MPGSRRLVATGITHAAALLIGWGGWTTWRHLAIETVAAAAVARPLQRSDRRAAEKILADFAAMAASQTAAALVAENRWSRMDDGLRDEFARAIAVTALPADFKTALDAEVAKMKYEEMPSMRIGALLYFWGREDPSGVVEWKGDTDNEETRSMRYFQDEIGRRFLAEGGLASLPRALIEPSTVARVYARAGDIVALRNLAQMNGQPWSKFANHGEIGELWPWPERDKLVDFAVSIGSVEMLLKLATTGTAQAAGGGAWILELLRDKSLDPGFQEKLANHEFLEEMARNDRTLSLGDRTALMEGGVVDVAEENLHFDEFAKLDVADILNYQRDWAYEFRHGSLDANEVLAAISHELPELAANSPATLRHRVFQNLIYEDPSRAIRLLDPLPPDERATMVLDTAKTHFFGTDPNLLLEALRLVPAEDARFHDARQEAWDSVAGVNFQDHDAAYVDWVLALPESVDREMALLALARTAEKKDGRLAARLHAERKSQPE